MVTHAGVLSPYAVAMPQGQTGKGANLRASVPDGDGERAYCTLRGGDGSEPLSGRVPWRLNRARSRLAGMPSRGRLKSEETATRLRVHTEPLLRIPPPLAGRSKSEALRVGDARERREPPPEKFFAALEFFDLPARGRSIKSPASLSPATLWSPRPPGPSASPASWRGRR